MDCVCVCTGAHMSAGTSVTMHIRKGGGQPSAACFPLPPCFEAWSLRCFCHCAEYSVWASWPATSGWVSHLHVHLSVERCDYSMSLPHLSFSGCSGDEMQVSGGTESALTPEFSYRLLLGVAAEVCPHRKVLGEVHSLLWTLWKSWCWVDTISSLNIEQTSLWLCGSADFIYRRFLITLTFHSQTWDYLDYLSVLA